MAVSFHILQTHFLVYIRYEGVMSVAENMKLMGDILSHPDHRIGMRGFIDLTHLTDWERDFPAIMRLHAAEVEVHDDPNHPTFVVCLAPNEFTQGVAQFINRTWDDSDRKVNVTVSTVPEAFAVLGIDAPSIAALLETT